MRSAKILIGLYLILYVAYTIYSFALTDPNLVFSSNPVFWRFQNFMWRIGYHQPLLSSGLFVGIISFLFIIYNQILVQVKNETISIKNVVFISVLTSGILIFANPALSHDIYNYAFNAKMVLFYHANPHVNVALDFPTDPWLKFMHNVHTPAPYGYGWTLLSLIPSALGKNYLQATLLFLKLFVGGFFLLTIFIQYHLSHSQKIRHWKTNLALFALNPLVLIETFGNGHNDVVMMSLALLSLAAFTRGNQTKRFWWWGIGILLFVSSVSIKYATLTLLGGVAIYVLFNRTKNRKISFGGSQTLALLTPLLTSRSQRFHPWYLIWSLAFAPLSQEVIIIRLVKSLSIASLFSYVPYLYTHEYTSGTIFLRSAIILLFTLIFLLAAKVKENITIKKSVI